MIQTLSSALNTGYSVENAFYETQKELKIQYPEEARISRELLLITRKLRMHIPVEQVLEEFAERVPSEDVKLCDSICNSEEKWRGYDRDYP